MMKPTAESPRFPWPLRVLCGLAAVAGALAAPAHAQPAGKPLTLVIPQPAGNPTDAISRKLQAALQRELGQTVIVDNLPGAGGSLGVQRALNQPADGGTVVVTSATEPILTPLTLKTARYKAEDLRVVGLVARGSFLLSARPDMPVQSLADLQAFAKRQPQPLSFGHIGPGSLIHLMGVDWARRNELQIADVAYKGVPLVMQDLIGGQIDLTFLPTSPAIVSMIQSGKVKALGSTAAAANPKLPQVPPMSASGKAMSDFVYGTWVAFLVPVSTPEAAVARLHRAIGEAMKEADFRVFVESSGATVPEPASLAELAKFYADETRQSRDLARRVGVKPE